MRYIIHREGTIVDTYEQDGNYVTLQYPGYESQFVQVTDEEWQKITQSPEKYVYKDGKVVLL